MKQQSPLPETTSRSGLLVGLALGLPVVAYGLRGALVDSSDTHPVELATWVVGLAVVNDFVVIPIALAAAWVVRRVIPAVAWAPVRTGLLTTGVLCLVAWPFVRGYGRNPTVPSLLARNYATGLAAALVVLWLGVAVWIALAVTNPSADGRPGRADRPGGHQTRR